MSKGPLGWRQSYGQERPILALAKSPIFDTVEHDQPLVETQPNRGHAERFRAIYALWFADVGRWVTAMGGRAADRDDLVQDVFLVVFRRLADFDDQNVGGWLYQITRRRVRDFRRSAWLRRLIFGSTALLDARAGHGFDPSESCETAEKCEHLERLLVTLNEAERVALVLFEIDNYSGEQIAEVQGVPTNTVWVRIRRARIKLRKALLKLESCEKTPPAETRRLAGFTPAEGAALP